MATRYPNSACEAHHNVKTSEPVCVICITNQIEKLQDTLNVCRDAIAEQPIDSFGDGQDDAGLVWPIRDELVDRITKALDWTETKTELPESGVPVIIASRNGAGKPRRLRAMYAAPLTLPLHMDCDDDNADYDEASDEYYCPEGWYENNEYDEINWRVEGTVTHWMPLPALPDGYNT